jgi:hypothetical protein
MRAISLAVIARATKRFFLRASREGYTLAFGSGAWGAGFLLDTWHDVRFDPATDTLLLATDRPTSEPYRERGQLMCNVDPRWVTVTLAAQPAHEGDGPAP